MDDNTQQQQPSESTNGDKEIVIHFPPNKTANLYQL